MPSIRVKHKLLHPNQTMPHFLLHDLAKLLQPLTPDCPSRIRIGLYLYVPHRSHHVVKAHLPKLIHGEDSHDIDGRRCGTGLSTRAEEDLDVEGLGGRASVLTGIN